MSLSQGCAAMRLNRNAQCDRVRAVSRRWLRPSFAHTCVGRGLSSGRGARLTHATQRSASDGVSILHSSDGPDASALFERRCLLLAFTSVPLLGARPAGAEEGAHVVKKTANDASKARVALIHGLQAFAYEYESLLSSTRRGRPRSRRSNRVLHTRSERAPENSRAFSNRTRERLANVRRCRKVWLSRLSTEQSVALVSAPPAWP